MPRKQQPKAVEKGSNIAGTISKGTGAASLSMYGFRVQAVIIALLAFIFYFNTFSNEYAFDDQMVIIKNEYVQEGFEGIHKILATDVYDSYLRRSASGRQDAHSQHYRPLSIITFAIEQQLMGVIPEDSIASYFKQDASFEISGQQHAELVYQMHVRHVVNVILFALSCIVLLYFLRYIVFKKEPVVAFIAVILFTIHPIHTEVVANVKSRDEILSLLFICLTFIFEFKYHEYHRKWFRWAALASYFLAFLSKEYAFMLIVLLPLSLYIFNKYTAKACLTAVLPFLAVAALYVIILFNVVGPIGSHEADDVLANAFIFATGPQALATKLLLLLNYFKLLVFPSPLCCDYTFNSFPFADFSNPLVWLSILFHVALVAAMVILVRKRHFMGFAIAFYLLFFLLVSNILINIGTPMGERLVYTSSVGFVIALALGIYKVAGRINPPSLSRMALTGFMLIIIILSGFKTISRNADWKNDITLFSKDINTVPGNILVCANVAVGDIRLADGPVSAVQRQEYLRNAISLLNYCLSIHRTYSSFFQGKNRGRDNFSAFLTRGAAWEKIGDIDKAKADLDSAKQINPSSSSLADIYKHLSDQYMIKGWEFYGKQGKYPQEINEYLKAIRIDSANADKWYNLGGAYFHNQQFQEALNAWTQCVKIRPDHLKGRRGIQSASEMLHTAGGQ